MSAFYDLEAQSSASESTTSLLSGFLTHSDPEMDGEVLPPYFEAPPEYTRTGSNEPVTLAMYMFKFGFGEYFIALLF